MVFQARLCHGNTIFGHFGPICPRFSLPFFIVFLCAMVAAQTAAEANEFQWNGGQSTRSRSPELHISAEDAGERRG